MRYKKLLLLPILVLSTLVSCKKSAGTGTTGPDNTVTTPSTPTIVCADNSGTPLSDVKEANLNKTFDGTVKVAGKKGSDLYVEDQTGGGFIYANKSTLPEVKVGDLIHVTGKIGSWSSAGIYQIIEPTVTVESSACKLSAPVTTTIADIDSHRMSRVKIEGLSVTKIEKKNNNDLLIDVTDGTNTTQIFVSYKLDTAIRDSIDAVVAKLAVGSKLSVNGAFADYYQKPQIAVTNVSQLVLEGLDYNAKVAFVEDSSINNLKDMRVRTNINLPTSGEYGATIKWESSNTKVISNTGVVTRPTDADKTVTLSYTITIDGKTTSKKSITVTVLKYVEGVADYEYTYVEPNYNGNYYTSIDEDARGDTLKMSLYNLLAKTKMPSNFTYKNLWSIFPDTDGVPGRSGYYYAFYTGKETARDKMNKEHVWPNSRGGNYPERDPHMVRPALIADNSGRGNAFYNVSSEASYDPGTLGNNEYRGIAARIIFYCAVKYQNNGLKLVDKTTDSEGNLSMGKLSTLLKWNLEYDIDKTEIQRNEALYSKYNWVRNPFIDDRNYACKIWGDVNSSTRAVCGGK